MPKVLTHAQVSRFESQRLHHQPTVPVHPALVVLKHFVTLVT